MLILKNWIYATELCLCLKEESHYEVDEGYDGEQREYAESKLEANWADQQKVEYFHSDQHENANHMDVKADALKSANR